jgi:hypothetical protein
MGYFNRHFNKQLNRHGFALLAFKANTGENVKAVVKIDEIAQRMNEKNFVKPTVYKTALSGRM